MVKAKEAKHVTPDMMSEEEAEGNQIAGMIELYQYQGF